MIILLEFLFEAQEGAKKKEKRVLKLSLISSSHVS